MAIMSSLPSATAFVEAYVKVSGLAVLPSLKLEGVIARVLSESFSREEALISLMQCPALKVLHVGVSDVCWKLMAALGEPEEMPKPFRAGNTELLQTAAGASATASAPLIRRAAA